MDKSATNQNLALQESLFLMYVENLNSLRHLEKERATVAQTFVAITALLGGFITFDGTLDSADIYASLFLVVLGVFGVVFCFKQWERCYLHVGRARAYRQLISEQFTEGLIAKLERETDAKHRQQFPILNHRYLGLHTVWIGFYGLVLMLGIGLTGLILAHGDGITL